MGPSSLILRPDNTVFEVDTQLPGHIRVPGLSLSAGVESTALLLLLIERYGADAIQVFTGKIRGRRAWESVRAEKMARRLGVPHNHIHVADDNFRFMSPEENLHLRQLSHQKADCDAWFNGANKLLFSHTWVRTHEHKKRLRDAGFYLPFIDLFKTHTVDVFFRLGKEDILYDTHSCTERGNIHCGQCYCCYERVRAFASIGERDRATYGVDWSEMLDKCFYSDHLIVDKW